MDRGLFPADYIWFFSFKNDDLWVWNWTQTFWALLGLAVALTVPMASWKSVYYPSQPNFPVGRLKIFISYGYWEQLVFEQNHEIAELWTLFLSLLLILLERRGYIRKYKTTMTKISL